MRITLLMTLLLCSAVLFSDVWVTWDARPPESDGLRAGRYEAVLDTPLGPLEFGIDLTALIGAGSTQWMARLVNGSETSGTAGMEVAGRDLVIRAGPSTTLRARHTEQGDLEGTWTIASARKDPCVLPFRAAYGWDFAPRTATNTFHGGWILRMSPGGHEVRLVVRAGPQHLVGVLKDGQHSGLHLSGEVAEQRLRLSRLDAHGASLLTGGFTSAGVFEGKLWRAGSGTVAWSASRDGLGAGR